MAVLLQAGQQLCQQLELAAVPHLTPKRAFDQPGLLIHFGEQYSNACRQTAATARGGPPSR